MFFIVRLLPVCEMRATEEKEVLGLEHCVRQTSVLTRKGHFYIFSYKNWFNCSCVFEIARENESVMMLLAISVTSKTC